MCQHSVTQLFWLLDYIRHRNVPYVRTDGQKCSKVGGAAGWVHLRPEPKSERAAAPSRPNNFCGEVKRWLVCRFDGRRWLKVCESVLVAAVSAVVFTVLIYAVPDCKPARRSNSTAADDSSPGLVYHVNTTATTTTTTAISSIISLSAGNSTDSDVIAQRDVTWTARDAGGEDEERDSREHDSYEHHGGGDGYVFQVRNVTEPACRLRRNCTNVSQSDSQSMVYCV